MTAIIEKAAQFVVLSFSVTWDGLCLAKWSIEAKFELDFIEEWLLLADFTIGTQTAVNVYLCSLNYYSERIVRNIEIVIRMQYSLMKVAFYAAENQAVNIVLGAKSVYQNSVYKPTPPRKMVLWKSEPVQGRSPNTWSVT